MDALSRVAGVAMIVLVSAVAAASPAAASPAASPGPSAHPSEHDRAYQLGLEAYVYGLPLLTMDATFQTMTSVTVSDGAFGPVNRFNHVRGRNTAGGTTVVAPGATSLSSIAWLDLSAGPQVLTVPEISGHAWMLALLDPWTENVAMLSSALGTQPGRFLIAGPGQHDVALAGAQRIDVDAARIWIIGSTQLLGPDDVAAVNRIQNGYTLAPLDDAGTSGAAPAPSPAVTSVTRHAVPAGLAFFDELGRLLSAFPPPAADAPLLAQLALVGIGPGLTPSTDPTVSAETRRGLADAAEDGPATLRADLQQLVAEGAMLHRGYLLGGFGRYGMDHLERAVISQIGLGAVVPEQAIYAMTWTDANGRPLTGSTGYVVHLPPDPPSREGWSLTVYDLHGALIANPLDRSALTDLSPLARNADGSVDIRLQAEPPTDPAQLANWLPIPAGEGFEVAWRLFAPQPSAIDGILDGTGWQPPGITPAD